MPRGRPKGSKNSVSYNLNLPKGGTRFVNTQKRIAAKAAAYAGMSAAMLSGANTAAARSVYGTPKKARGRPRNVVVNVVSGQLSAAPAPRVRQVATAKQIAALAKARATRAANRGDYVSLPKGGYKALSSRSRLAMKAAAYGAYGPGMISGGNVGVARNPYGTLVDGMGRFAVRR